MERVRELSKLLAVTLTSIAAFHTASVLFGAALFWKSMDTLLFSTFLAFIGVFPVALLSSGKWWLIFNKKNLTLFRNQKLVEAARLVSVWTILGSILGSLFVPLDWNHRWQVWPISCYIAATVSCFMGFVVLLLAKMLPNIPRI